MNTEQNKSAKLERAGEEWQEILFSQATIINPKVQLLRGTSYPFVDMGAINGNLSYVSATERRIFKGGGSRFIIGDILMARITPCLENGKISRFYSEPSTKEAHGSTEFIVVRGRDGISDSTYIYYLIKSKKVHEYAIAQMTGTSGRQRVPVGAFDHLKVKIPPLEEQRAIAHILGTLDDKIELNRRTNETLEAMAQALFKFWFVDFGPVRAKMEGRWRRGQSLPGLPAHLFDLFPDRLVDSELGEIPEGWEVGTLGNLAKIASGKRPPLQSLEYQTNFKISLWGGNGPMAFVKEPLFQCPILLTGRVGTLGSVFRIKTPCWPSDNTLIVITHNDITYEFLYFQMKLINYKSLNRGSTQPLLTQSDLKNQVLILPSKNILQYFHIIINNIFLYMDNFDNISHTLATIRDTLLPKLISGELRVRK